MTRKAAPGGGRSRSGGRTERDAKIRELKELGISVAIIVVVSGLSRRQVERILSPSDQTVAVNPPGQRPRIRGIDPKALEHLATTRADCRHNGRRSIPLRREDEPCDDADSQADQTRA